MKREHDPNYPDVDPETGDEAETEEPPFEWATEAPGTFTFGVGDYTGLKVDVQVMGFGEGDDISK